MPSTTTVDVTLIIPTIPPRAEQLKRALESVEQQTAQPVEVMVLVDENKEGPSTIRNRGIFTARTKYIAFLDDDDYLFPEHISHLYELAEKEEADLVYPWADFLGHRDPLAVKDEYGSYVNPFGRPFGEIEKNYILNEANFIPVTVLARADISRHVGGFPQLNSEVWPRPTCEDWGYHVQMLKAGAKYVHLPERTWAYVLWQKSDTGTGNLGGSPTLW